MSLSGAFWLIIEECQEKEEGKGNLHWYKLNVIATAVRLYLDLIFIQKILK